MADRMDVWREVLEDFESGPLHDARGRVAAVANGWPEASVEAACALLQAVASGRQSLARGDTGALVEHVRAADAQLDSPYPPADARSFTLFVASLYQAAFRFTGRADLRDRGIDRARQVADQILTPEDAVRARAILATIHIISGRMHATMDACDAALDLARATGQEGSSGAALAMQFRGYVLFEWNQLGAARTSLEEAWAWAERRARGIRSGTARLLAHVTAVLGDTEASDEWFARLETEVAEPMTLRNREWLAAVRVLHGARGGADLRALDAWSHRYDYPTNPETSVSAAEAATRLHEYEHLLTLLEATRQWPALASVAQATLLGAGETRTWFIVRAHAALAVALLGMSRPTEADQAWSSALRIGDAEGLVRVYLAGSPLRRRLLDRALQRPADHERAQRVLASDPSAPDLPPLLTPKQREALRLVAAGRTNAEVAAAMGTSVSTTRTHLRAVFSKLGVRSRTAAVAEARRQGRI